MTQRFSNLSRRQFLGGLASSALVVGAGGLFMPALGQDNLLDFRLGADPLLLHFNENSLGMSPMAIKAVQDVAVNAANRYPDNFVADLRETLGKRHGVPTEQVILGNGSTEVIQAIVTVAARMGAKVIEPDPTFGDVRRYAKAEGMQVIAVPVGGDFVTDIAALRAAAEATGGPLLINICNPNNPTGTIVDSTALFNWIDAAPDDHIFLLDEAYVDYAEQNPAFKSGLALVQAGRENVVVTRTFSKVYGMAGMRIGYGLAAPKTAKSVRRFSANFNLSATGSAAALASLKDEAYREASVASNARGRATLLETLDGLGLMHIESNTNFVLHRINSDVKPYQDRMMANGVRVGRRMTADEGWNRISIGTPDEMVEFTRVLRAFRERGWV
ncbi:pyridoxal phosphate-dependent aminotransferase [Kordiimonas aquimaris]|uniref:pyridoxal phosphate-dependent aminotransferase n=1 Tax=Kordiimonas aquimaris TaxID=707591 RepID=UPI0021D1C464|nr:histidinol-phosphate transaminase [Kordiimonas aquimaris]